MSGQLNHVAKPKVTGQRHVHYHKSEKNYKSHMTNAIDSGKGKEMGMITLPIFSNIGKNGIHWFYLTAFSEEAQFKKRESMKL